MKRIILGFTFIALLFGCATTANYEKMLSSWMGASADSLVQSWGPPDNSYQLSDGGKVLTYNKSRNMTLYTQTPVTTYQNGTVSTMGMYGGGSVGSYSGTSTSYVNTPMNINQNCTTRFTVNSSGRITNWAWEGNACRMR